MREERFFLADEAERRMGEENLNRLLELSSQLSIF